MNGETTPGAGPVRDPAEIDVEPLGELWYRGWRDAHEEIVPAELTRLRTFDSFRERLQAGIRNVRVIGRPGEPIGFSMLKDDELYQFYVSAPARGTGVAAVLMADAEDRLFRNGVATAWLACAIGNNRAARFYEKSGWHRAGTMLNRMDTSSGEFLLEVWRYEKDLRPQA